MATLISAEQKNLLQTAFNDLHDTFKRSFKVFKQGAVLSIHSDQNYNYVFDNEQNTQTVQEYVVEARIHNMSSKVNRFLKDSGLQQDDSERKIIFSIEDSHLFKDIVRIEIDGLVYKVKDAVKVEGLFGPHYNSLIITREN